MDKDRNALTVFATGVGGIVVGSTIGYWLYPGDGVFPGAGSTVGAFVGFVLAALVSIRG